MAKSRLKRMLGKKKVWFKSTLSAVIIIFAIFSTITLLMYGVTKWFESVVFYGLGLSGATIIIILLGRLLGKKIKMN